MTTKTAAQGSNGIAEYVRDGRVRTSSELIQLLTKRGFEEANARKFISRHSNTNGVWRSNNLKLARDERLFAEKQAVGTRQFFTAVAEKLRGTSRKGLARCVSALAAHGVLHRVEVMRLLAVSIVPDASTNPRNGTRYEDEVEALRELGAWIIQAGTALESIAAPGPMEAKEMDSLANDGAKKKRYETLLTRILTERLRRQNMLSWNRIDLPDVEQPYTVFNTQLFSGYGFSYLSPILRWKEEVNQPTPCPVLIDCYHGVCALAQVESFLQRIDRATVRRNRRMPTLGVIAARDFDRDAWETARHRGLMTISFRQMFGDEALDTMVQVEELLSGLGLQSVTKGQERFEEMMKLIEELKANPVIVDLRSIGLEALCGLILQSRGYESVELGRIVPWKETSRDVDVFAIRGDTLRILECKAYHRRKSIPGADVDKFFTQTVPALKKWMRQTGRYFTKCKAEIWTTGPKGKAAEDALRGLRCPKNDTWNLRRMSDMHEEIPKPIRKRSVQLLESISLIETGSSSVDD